MSIETSDKVAVSLIEGRLVYQDSIPLAWKALQTRPNPAEIILLQNSNEEILKALYALDESHMENDDPHDLYAQQFMRMDAKINFLMDMVGQLLLKSLILPEQHAVSLLSTGVHWDDKLAPKVDEYIHIELYLKINYPKPLILPAVVNSVDYVSAEEFKITANFDGLTTLVEESLEKLIFRHHRRLIAMTRREPF